MHPLVQDLNDRITRLNNAGVEGGGILRECAQELEILERQRDYWQAERMKLLHFIKTQCRVQYWPKDGRPPIVHNPFTAYDGDQMDALLAEMRAQSSPNTKDEPRPAQQN